MKTLVTNLKGRCLFDVSMKTQIDGLICIQTDDSKDACLDKFIKGGAVKIDTQDYIEAVKTITGVIRGAKKHGEVFVAYNGGEIGALLGFIANKEEVDGVFTCFKDHALRMPLLKLDLSDTRLRILEALEKENLTAISIGKKVGISRAMVYKHLSGLLELGLVKQSQMFEKYSITQSGKLILI
ncbi:ArsR family transcriptional regulator [Methanobacterium alcaliphilum]|uniref:ArsR family transcriptional regulator n=1 Tax=Methanobacterium alcaliphilum TaxID=392018 RepID=UPI00200B5191|nr:ArsR family transcriptional regulator [Methanobacterium alcaliphilum]MCK9151564.1 ArsR family transcriptional regulator [Methanobacterium alcaliphilum]